MTLKQHYGRFGGIARWVLLQSDESYCLLQKLYSAALIFNIEQTMAYVRPETRVVKKGRLNAKQHLALYSTYLSSLKLSQCIREFTIIIIICVPVAQDRNG